MLLLLSTTAAAESRVWDGFNPYHQPMNTTYYYGSGDVNLDGVIDGDDVDDAFQMSMGILDPAPMADVNGDQSITAADYTMIFDYITGQRDYLPAHWNALTTEAERQGWLDKMLAIDQTNRHNYVYEWFLCGHFLRQIYAHFTGFVGDMYATPYTGGQTLYNIPMYDVGVPGHGIDGVLIGDDPQNIDDWFFLDTYSDLSYNIYTNLSAGDELSINAMDHTEYGFDNKLRFQKTSAGGFVLTSVSATFTTDRVRPSAPAPTTPINTTDIWNPVLVDIDGGALVYDSLRQDMSRVTDIHIADLPFDASATPDGTPMVNESTFSRLLDIEKDAGGNIHVLYLGKLDVNPPSSYPQYTPGVFYAQMDPATRTLSTPTRLFSDDNRVRSGRLVVAPGGTVHAFWYENQYHDFTSFPETGVYWAQNSGAGWSTAQNLTPGIDIDENDDEYRNQYNRDFYRYAFDVALVGSRIWLVWTERVSGTVDARVSERIFESNTWGTAQVIENGNTRGLDICEMNGALHLVTWNGARPSDTNEGRGNLNHRINTGAGWSAPDTLDNSGTAACPRMVDAGDGRLFLVWESESALSADIVPIFNIYQGGAWQTAQEIDLPDGAECWYPMVEKVADSIMMTFSSRSDAHVTADIVELGSTNVDTDISLEYYSPNRAVEQNTLYVNVRVYNDAETPVALSALSAEYYYTFEGAYQSEQAAVDWCGVFPDGETTAAAAAVDTIDMGGQNRRMTLSFAASDESIANGGYVECQVRIHKSDWSNYTQSNDYSFGDHAAYTGWDNMTVTLDGVTVWGVAP